MDTVHRGWLYKAGGEGHNYKNSKKRWFVLKDLFLYYYSGPPVRNTRENGARSKNCLYASRTFVLWSLIPFHDSPDRLLLPLTL